MPVSDEAAEGTPLPWALTTGRDYERMAQYARGRLIVAAAAGEAVRYRQLSPFAHLRWYSTRVLGRVFTECESRGEPDLMWLLVRRGFAPEDHELAVRVWDYWRQVQP